LAFIVADVPSDEEALRFEAALFEDLRRTVRHFRDRPIKIERLSLVGWPPDTQVAVVFDTGSRLVERMFPAWAIDGRGEPFNVFALSMSIWGDIEEMLTMGFPEAEG
jgi:hypothetical protein